MRLEKPTIVLFDMDGTTVRHVNPVLLNILEWLDDLSHKIAQFFSKVFKRKIKSPPLVGLRKSKTLRMTALNLRCLFLQN